MSSSDSDSDSSSDEEEQQKQVQTTATANDDSDSSDSDSSDDEEETKVAAKTAAPAEKAESDSDSDSDSDSEDEKPAAKTPATTKTAQAEESDSDSDSDSEEEQPTPAATKPSETKAEESDSDSDSDSDDEEEKTPAAKPAETKAEESDSDSDSDSDDEEEKKPAAKPVETKAEDSDSDSDSDSEEEEEKKPAEAAATKAEESDGDSDDEEEKETEDFSASLASNLSITPIFSLKLKSAEKSTTDSGKKGKKRKLENAESRQAKKKKQNEVKEEKAEEKEEEKATEESEKPKKIELTKEFFPNSGEFRNENLKGSSRTVMVRGISISAFESDIREFFKSTIEDPERINHKWSEERPGIAFVSFSSPEVASAAVINSHKEYIKDRYVFCDWAEDFKPRAGKSNRGPRNAHLKDTTSRIWIGNLHREVYEDAIQELFKDVGTLTDIFIIGKDESRPKVAYVSFSTNEEASACVEKFQNHSLMDYNMRLDWAEPRKDNGSGGRKRKRELSEKQDGCVTVFLGGLTEEVNDEKLAEFFKEAGTIELIRYPEPWKGIAFCKFTETEATDKAVLKNGTLFMGRTLRVDFAADKKRQKEW